VTRARVSKLLPSSPPGKQIVVRALLQCAAPTALMAFLIAMPHLLVGRPALLPIWAAPAGLACAAGYLLLVLDAQDKEAMAGMLPGRGRVMNGLRGRLRGAP